MKKAILTFVTVCTVAMFTACETNKTVKGTAIGAGGGAALGALAGLLFKDKGKGAVIGASIGTAVGAGTGALIGKHMDKKAAELQKELEKNAQVETVTDGNGLTAIKVTFEQGILFATNATELKAEAKTPLTNFAKEITQSDLVNTDVLIKGHTDNTGTREVNDRISLQRAQSVGNLLRSNGVASVRITEAGMAYDEPVASNETAEGRAQNRRVEVFLLANEGMVQQAANNQLK